MGIPITFDAKGDITAVPISVFKVEKGDFALVTTVSP
jgi:hypothetical protein